MMGDSVKQILESITRVEAQFKPRESWTTSNNTAEGNYQGLILLCQLDETKRILHALQPTLEGHKSVHRELYRAVIQTETSANEWWSSGRHNDEPVLAKRREHFLEILLAVRWWTMVTALQAGKKFTGSEIYRDVLVMKRKGVSQVNSESPLKSSYVRHLPSYGFEIWLQGPESRNLNEILQWEIESGNILGEDEYRANMALGAIRSADFPGSVVEGMLASYVDEAKSPPVKEEVTMDLTRDVLGVSRTGSWVIRTKCQGVECALKRADDCDRLEQPVIARLSHPHIVQLMHYWRKDKYLFLVMELMEGDLTDLLSRHKRANESLLSLPVAVDIMLQTAKGMLYLHDLNITYPHLNCSNVLFRQSGKRPEAFQDGYVEYMIKLSGGGYSTKDASNGRKMQDVHRFGLFCLEVLTGSQQCEDSLDVFAETRPRIPENIPPILRYCIASCFEGNLHLGFEQMVTFLLLAQYQVLKSQKNEAFLSFGSEDLEAVQLNQPDSESPSTSDADIEKYPIHQLYPEPDVSGSDSNRSATLIFFHGFAKSPDEWKSTWMTRNREHVWPKAWLPKDLPGNVRILSLAYDTDAPGKSQDIGAIDAIDIGKNVLMQLVRSSKWNLAGPFVLIGHSFGGLIIKSLVVEASNQAYVLGEPKMGEPRSLVEKCQSFLENLKGIVFYSVPGSASQDQQFEQYIDRLNQTGVLQRSLLMQAVLRDERLFYKEMQSLCSQFKENVPETTKILGFIEGKGMRKINEKQVVVSEALATAQLKKADFAILEEDNHFEVCRPVSIEHKGYKILVEHFLKGILEIGRKGPESESLRLKREVLRGQGKREGLRGQGKKERSHRKREKSHGKRWRLCRKERSWGNWLGTMVDNISNSILPDGITQITDSVYLLSEPPMLPKIEIVFIHGLQLSVHKEAYWKTWIAEEKDKDGKEICWPKTWLEEDIPDARILSLSHDYGNEEGDILGETLVKEMVELAQIGQQNCPVVFVCHSLGGLVVKDVVIKAHVKSVNNPKYLKFLQNIRGFHFYATPHTESKLADLAYYVPGKGKMVEQLRVVIKELGRLNAEFEYIERDHYASRWQFSVVAESLKTTFYGFSAMVVEEASARYVYKNFLSVPADHFGVCKPKNKVDSRSYQTLRNFIAAVVNDNNLSYLEHPLDVPSLVVGMEDRLQKICQTLEVHPAVGLVGMGGVGKTTLSKLFFSREKERFETSCYLEDVKLHGIKSSQKQLFSELCSEEWSENRSVNFHLEKIKQCIMTRRVLLVVDDPGTEMDLKALLVDAFKDGTTGSKVIVTTRNRGTLHHFVEGIIDVEFLNEAEALELFSYYAFDNCDDSVRKQYEDIAMAIVMACGGLPLSLEVMGQFFREKNHVSHIDLRMGIWEEALEKLRRAVSLDGSHNSKLWATLKIGYDDLHDDHKSMFLDFACIMCEIISINSQRSSRLTNQRFEKQKLVRIWDTAIGVQNLIDRSFIKWDGDKKTLVMHDQLRDLGRWIVMDKAGGNIANMSRLWTREKNLTFLLQNNISRTLEGLLMYRELEDYDVMYDKVTGEDSEDVDIDDDGLQRKPGVSEDKGCFERLRLLNLQGSELGVVEYCVQLCSDKLNWLCLNGTKITQSSIQKLGSFQNLRVLQMMGCKELEEVPTSLGNLSLLTELDLSWCSRLKSLPETFGDLENLLVLLLRGCKNLRIDNLPCHLGQLSRLEHLNLEECWGLKEGIVETIHQGKLCTNQLETLHLPIFPSGGLPPCPLLKELSLENGMQLTEYFLFLGNNLSELEKLTLIDGYDLDDEDAMDCGSVRMLVLDSSCMMERLSELQLWGFGKLELLENRGHTSSLQKLHLHGCSTLVELPGSLGQLSKLRSLNLEECKSLVVLPESLGGLSQLQSLNLEGCKSLVVLPESLGGLYLLQSLNLEGCKSLVVLPESLGGLYLLQSLNLEGCKSLVVLPESLGGLSQLQSLNLEECMRLERLPESLGGLSQLQSLNLEECMRLERLPESLGGLYLLQSLNLAGCSDLMELPEFLGGLFQLQSLNLEGCKSLVVLPESLGGLSLLQSLNLAGCSNLMELPESLGGLFQLQSLNLEECMRLERLPESLGGLYLLQSLNLEGCKSLVVLPESLGGLSQLQSLNLVGCKSLVVLPESLGGLSLLQSLNLAGCSNLMELPESLGGLFQLQSLNLEECMRLERLPESLGRLYLLQSLNLARCSNLMELPESLGGLSQLQSLNLVGCRRLERLPESLGQLSQLQSLNLEE